MKTLNKTQADVLLILFSVIWGLSFPITKSVLSYTPVFLFLAFRFGSAAIFLVLAFWKKARQINKDTIIAGILIGISFFGSLTFQVSSLQFTSSSNSAFICGLSVILVPVISTKISGRKLNKGTQAGVALSLIGLFFISGSLHYSFNLGDLLALLSALCMSIQIILIEKYSARLDPAVIGLLQVTFCACLYLIIAVAMKPASISITSELILATIITGVLGTAVAYSGLVYIQKFTSSTHTVIIFSTEPVFATIFSLIWWNQHNTVASLQLNTILGCVFILASVLITELWKK
ncbi:DMT family transporter [Paenibacillus zanthoxyli]|uniref:DMT family transporter n=1 Tax=Paenibacillus zanthoxyli TaxID=369399 RepID=UPI0004B7EE81|nr:DMT family transporter [Paenibacillus zanthoxyli]